MREPIRLDVVTRFEASATNREVAVALRVSQRSASADWLAVVQLPT